VDFVAKPKLDVSEGLKAYADEIIEKVRSAATARVRAVQPRPTNARREPPEKHSADVILRRSTEGRHLRTTDRIIGIGSSTGGTEAIKDVLAGLPGDIQAGIVISQHIPAAFSAPFAKRVDGVTALSVCEAREGQQILPGHVYIAPGDRHLLVQRDGARYICRLNDGPPVNRHRPSVDVMLRSLAQNAGPNAIGLMLTGMGDDGAAGMGELSQLGAPVVVQDEKTSVVWGMPGEVVKRGFADQVLPLGKIADHLQVLVGK
jgi:two-component system chemotaxis response regulator CheB